MQERVHCVLAVVWVSLLFYIFSVLALLCIFACLFICALVGGLWSNFWSYSLVFLIDLLVND